MRFRLTQVCLGFAAGVLAASAAHAFTVENKDDAGQYGVPKFNLEEQAKAFRKDGTGGASTGMYSTPFGSGTLQFGVTQGATSGFGSATNPFFSPGLGFSGGSINTRQDFNRIVAPPSSLEFSGVR